MRAGISGHQRLRNPDDWEWVRQEMRACIAHLSQPVVGVTSLAIGADTLFAEIVLALGGTLEVVVPFSGYEEKFTSDLDRQNYLSFVARSERVEVLRRHNTDEESYYAAGKRVVDLSELVVLVWDGKPAAGLGGTADIAQYAQSQRKSVVHLNPRTRVVTGTGSGLGESGPYS